MQTKLCDKRTNSRKCDGGERHELQSLFQGRPLLLVFSGVAIPVVAIFKLNPQLADFGLGKDIRDPFNDERRWFLLIWGGVAWQEANQKGAL